MPPAAQRRDGVRRSSRESVRGTGAAARVRTAPVRARVCLIAIAGGSGSGKTWLARQLCRRLRPHAAVVSLDDFYRDLSDRPMRERAEVNFDSPRAIEWPLLAARLKAMAGGGAVELPRYDFPTHTRRARPRRWRPRPIVLVEGLWPWWRRELKSLYALKVFLSVPAGLRLSRRLERDLRLRGRSARSVRGQWERQVEPCYARYVRGQGRSADVRLTQEMAAADLDRLARRIRALIPLPHEAA